jgi:hypothetical protein
VVVEATDRHGTRYEISRIWNHEPDVYIDGKLRPGVSIRETIITKPLYFGQKDFRFLYAIRTCGDDGLIFGSINGKVIDSTIWEKLLPENVDAHGLRTDLETWRQEQTKFPTDVGAVQLDHVIRDPQNDMIPANLATRIYARSPLYNKRREMMIEWDLFLTGGNYGADLLEQWKVRLQMRRGTLKRRR